MIDEEPLPLIDVYSPIAELFHDVLEEKFKDREQRQKVANTLIDWLTTKAKKRPVPDLEKRLEAWSGRIRKMVENLRFEFSEAKPVIKVAGSDESTLKALQYGSNWFEPNAELEETILTGLFET